MPIIQVMVVIIVVGVLLYFQPVHPDGNAD